MGNESVAIEVPAANGVGAEGNTATLGVYKTFCLTGDLQGQVVVEASNDGINYIEALSFQTMGTKSLRLVARFIRARVTNYVNGTATMGVGGQNKINAFEALDVPSGDGVGAETAVNTYGGLWSVIVYTGMDFIGALTLELSQDGSTWAEVFKTFTGDGHETRLVSASRVRVRREGYDPNALGAPPTIALGITADQTPSLGGGVYVYDFPLNNIEDFGAVSNGDTTTNRVAVRAAIDDAMANNVAGILVPHGVFGLSRDATISGSIRLEGVSDFIFAGLGPASILRQEGSGGGHPGADWKLFSMRSKQFSLTVPSGNATGASTNVGVLPRVRVITFDTFDAGATWVGTVTVEDSPDGSSWSTRAVFTDDGAYTFESTTANFARVVTTGHSAGTGTLRYGAPCQRIWVHGITTDGSGVSNVAEQTHLWEVGAGDISTGNAIDIKFTDDIFANAYGDGLRFIGANDVGDQNYLEVIDILVDGCVFFDDARCAVAIQRALRRCVISNCYAHGGTDQIIDFEPSGMGDADISLINNIFRGTYAPIIIALSGDSTEHSSTNIIFSRNLVLDGNIHGIHDSSFLVEDNIVIGHATNHGRPVSISDVSYIIVRGNVIIRLADAAGSNDAASLSVSGQKKAICEDNIVISPSDTQTMMAENASEISIRRNYIAYTGPLNTTWCGVYIRSNLKVATVRVCDNVFDGNSGGGRWEKFVILSASSSNFGQIIVTDNVGQGALYGIQFGVGGGVFPFAPVVKNSWLPSTSDFLSLNELRTQTTPSVILQAVCIGGNVASGAARIYTQVGSPEGVFPAPLGSLYVNRSGGASTTLYVKESGTTTSTGWVAK